MTDELKKKLSEEYDNEKNETPFSEHSLRFAKRWWKCSKNHSYEASISNRMRGNNDCPYCSGRRLLIGFNDFKTLYPKLSEEYDIEKNNDYPSEIYPSKIRKVWWKCPKNHSYEATFGSRLIRGTGCPYCSNRKVLEGFNDLTTTHPKIAKQWHHDRNKDISINEVSYGSTKKVWWICKNNHEWMSVIAKRQTRGCPYCSNQKIISGMNDLATVHPKIAEEWNEKKNDGMKANRISPATPSKYWWKCYKGHEWRASVNDRTIQKTNCPYCSRSKVMTGETDVKTVYPEIVEESWDFQKNSLISPDSLSSSSRKKFWWKCSLEHSFKMSVVNRVKLKSECPYCSNRRVLEGFNDLLSKFPGVAEEWNYEKNEGYSPQSIGFKSVQQVWWKCSKNHEWEASVYSRTVLGTRCSRCRGGKHSSNSENQFISFVESLRDGLTVHSRKIIAPYELDIYIPDLKVAFEFNGLYWHSEQRGKDRTYHQNKWKKCCDKNIQLFSVWESEWLNEREFVEDCVRSIVGMNDFSWNDEVLTKDLLFPVSLEKSSTEKIVFKVERTSLLNVLLHSDGFAFVDKIDPEFRYFDKGKVYDRETFEKEHSGFDFSRVNKVWNSGSYLMEKVLKS